MKITKFNFHKSSFLKVYVNYIFIILLILSILYSFSNVQKIEYLPFLVILLFFAEKESKLLKFILAQKIIIDIILITLTILIDPLVNFLYYTFNTLSIVWLICTIYDTLQMLFFGLTFINYIFPIFWRAWSIPVIGKLATKFLKDDTFTKNKGKVSYKQETGNLGKQNDRNLVDKNNECLENTVNKVKTNSKLINVDDLSDEEFKKFMDKYSNSSERFNWNKGEVTFIKNESINRDVTYTKKLVINERVKIKGTNNIYIIKGLDVESQVGIWDYSATKEGVVNSKTHVFNQMNIECSYGMKIEK